MEKTQLNYSGKDEMYSSCTLELLNAFKLEREGESERFKPVCVPPWIFPPDFWFF
jgi:hypothetical protein